MSWSWLEAAAVVGVALVAGDLIRDRALGPDGPRTAADLGKILAESVWLVVVLAWIAGRRHGLRAVLGRPGRLRNELVDAAVFGALLNGAVVLLVVLPLRALVGEAVADPQGGTELRALTGAGVAAALSFTLLVAPVVEEVLFRGVLFRGVRDRFGPLAGVAVSSAAFGAIHWVPFGATWSAVVALATAAMGAGLSIQYERRRSLISPVVAHVSFNVVGVLASLR